jgi:hypothetical protein
MTGRDLRELVKVLLALVVVVAGSEKLPLNPGCARSLGSGRKDRAQLCTTCTIGDAWSLFWFCASQERLFTSWFL